MTTSTTLLDRLHAVQDFQDNGDGCAPMLVLDRDGYDLLAVHRAVHPLTWGLGVEVELRTPETADGFVGLAVQLTVGPFTLLVSTDVPFGGWAVLVGGAGRR